VDVLWVKGSGGDLGTARRESFASLDLERLAALEGTYRGASDGGPKSPAEDRIVGLYPLCTFGLNPTPCSIDTPLHALVPATCVDHTHPNSVIAVAAAARSASLTREIYGDEVGWLPWQRPGFDLALRLRDLVAAGSGLRGVVLGGHGLMSWADDDRACYENTLDLIERATAFIDARDRGPDTFGGARHASLPEVARRALLLAVLPWLRGRLCGVRRMVAAVDCSAAMQRFVNSVDAPRLAALGTSCPDHFLRTKIRPLLVDWDAARGDAAGLKRALAAGLEQYRAHYQAYHQRCRRPDSPAMRDPNPTVILLPGVGMIAWGKSTSEARMTGEFYNCAVEVMRGAEAIDSYTALPAQEAFDIEYWALEEAKLQRQPPPRDKAGAVAVVAGAGSGIGRVVALRLADEGAAVVCADRDEPAARAAAEAVVERTGPGLGRGCGSGPALAAAADITQRDAVVELLAAAVFAYGGVDDLIVTAGLYPAPDAAGRVSDERWRATFDANVLGPTLLAEEARRIWEEQGTDASMVLVTSVNAVVPKAGSLAYDASKAAANHLVRELAVSLAPRVRVNGVAPATVVEGSSMFPRDRVLASLARYRVAHDAAEPTESLRQKLAEFYAQRTLLKTRVRAEDQAEAVLFLLSRRASRTTGQILTVDGGLVEAFLR
jgi:rhamnulose-1-phosphate aldolase/alcohol dehydrogenase